MSTNDTYLNGVLRERADDTTRTVTTYGPTGQVTNTRPYTTAESTAAADAAEQAKALAFDCRQAIEQQQQNLRALQQRIAQLSEEATND